MYIYIFIHKKNRLPHNCPEQHVSPPIFGKSGKTGYKNKKIGCIPLKMRCTQFLWTGYKSGYKRVHFPPRRMRFKALIRPSEAV